MGGTLALAGFEGLTALITPFPNHPAWVIMKGDGVQRGEGEPMHTPTEQMGSELVDLSEVPLSALRTQDPLLHAPALDRLLRQIERPRINFGGGGGEGPSGD